MRLCISLMVALVMVFAVAAGAVDTLLVDDSLQVGTIGTRIGGNFANGGFEITGQYDAVYWHLPYPVHRGKAEFYVKGIGPNECRSWMNDKCEIYHMYDSTYGNSDNDYGGYRNNPYKHYIRKIGCVGGSTDAMELVWCCPEDYEEPDTSVLSWNAATNYHFEERWYPDSSGNTIIDIYRDGVLIKSITGVGGLFNPQIPSVRIGASSRRMADYGAPLGGVYSYFKVYDQSSTVPSTPEVIAPKSGGSTNTTSPRIIWAFAAASKYQVRLNAANNPDTSIAWDSGAVISNKNMCIAGPVSNNQNYYVFVRLWNAAGWSAWSASGYVINVNTSYTPPNNGLVTLSGRSFCDNTGPFLALGATYMSGLRFCKEDRDRFRGDCAFLSSKGFNYVRILTMVPWPGREIAPIDCINSDGAAIGGWPDYWQQFRDCIDIAYDEFGLRTEVTIFAGATESMPNEANRYAHMDGIISNIAGREHKVLMIEVANEFYQNGLTLTQLRDYGAYLNARTGRLIALSSSGGGYSLSDVYNGSAADLATEHFSRTIGTFEGGWLPVRDCWSAPGTPGVPAAITSNEPIGPGSSVNTENDPIKLVSAACFAWTAGLPGYVFHSRPGTFAEYRFEDMPGSRDFRYLQGILPGYLANGTRSDAKDAGSPFTVFCDGYANQYWTDPGRSGANAGCHRLISSRKGCQITCYVQGIKPGGVTLQSRQQFTFTVYNPMTGAIALGPITKNNGESVTLSQGPGAYIIKGSLGNDTTPPGQPIGLAATDQNRQIIVSWTSPADPDLAGVKVVYSTTGYPATDSDGTLLYEGTGTSCSQSGITGGTTYYYSAFAYDACLNYSTRATTSVVTSTSFCYADAFSYPDGSLNGNNGWSGAAGTEISVLGGCVKITGGGVNVQASKSVTCSGSGGVIGVEARINAEVGTATLWGIWIDDAAGRNLARWYGQAVTARPRIGDSGLVLDPVNLTGGWDTLALKINTNTDTDEFFFNGVSLGTLSHSSQGAGNSVGRIRFERVENCPAGNHMYIDDLVVGPLDATSPSPVTNFKAAGGDAQVALTWTNPPSDFLGVKAVYKTTGYPANAADGSVVYTGVGAAVNHTSLTNGTRYYYSIYAYDAFANYSTPATVLGVPALDASILEAKGLDDGQVRYLRNKIVTGLFPGGFFVQEPDALQGIKALSSISVAPGNKVDIVGAMAGKNAERYLDATGNPVDKTAPGPGSPAPIALNSAAIGGVALNGFAPGVTAGIGPNNIGLLVTTFGKVTRRQTTAPMYFYIDDGCGLKDGTTTDGIENVGIRISGDPASYAIGANVAVTGMVSCFSSSGLRPQLLPVTIQVLAAP